MKMHQSILICDEGGHIDVFSGIRPKDRLKVIAFANDDRSVTNLEESSSLAADYGSQEGAGEVPWGKSFGFGSLTNILTNSDNPACHGCQCQSGKRPLLTNPPLDNLSSFLACYLSAQSAM